MVPEQLDATILMPRWPETGDFRDRCLATMRAVRHGCTWTVDEQGQFRVAMMIVLSKAEGEDREWAEHQVKTLRKLNAMLAAMQAGLDVSVPETEDDAPKRDYALMDLWHRSAAPPPGDSDG